MPEIIHYTVTQTRTIDVSANNVLDAVQIAEAAFKYGQNSDKSVIDSEEHIRVPGYLTSRVREIALDIAIKEK